MMKQIFIAITIFASALPTVTFATLSSENFKVEGYSVGTPNLTTQASSTNYNARLETGGLYRIPTTTPPLPPSSSPTSGTKVKEGSVLSKTDSITICHSKDGVKYVSLTNVQVFITLGASGAAAELRGHDGHTEDIIPPFRYNIGTGVQSYLEKNWTTANQELYADNCAKFLAQSEPVVIPPPVVPPPAPPVVEPVVVCDTSSSYIKTTTALNDQTLITVEVPAGAVSSPSVETKGKKNYLLGLQIQTRTDTSTAAYVEKFATILTSFETGKNNAKIVAPAGLQNKVTPVPSYAPPAPTTQTRSQTPVRSTIVVSEEPPCEPVASTVTPPQPPTTTPPQPLPSLGQGIIVSEVLTPELITKKWPVTDIAPIVPPFSVGVVDELGNYLATFESPIIIEIKNPLVKGLQTGDLLIVMPSADGDVWYEVPYTIDDDMIRLTIERPGDIFIWFLPKPALAATSTPVAAMTQPFLAIEINSFWQSVAMGLGLAAGFMYSLFQFASVPFSLTNLGRALLQVWQNLIALLTFKKKRQPWGTIYDSKTKAPLDPAYVELFDEAGAKVAEAITDLDGRYGFVVPEGNYSIMVRKSNYIFPSRLTTLTGQDVIYHDLYFGGKTRISSAVAHDIPMDPVNFDWNQHEKLRTGQTKFFNLADPLIVRFLDLTFFVGFLIMLWQFLHMISTYTAVMLTCYLVLFVYRFVAKRPPLFGLITKNGTLVQNALIHIYQGEQKIFSKVSDNQGRYVAIVPPGSYRLVIEEMVSEATYRTLYTGAIQAKQGVINTRFKL